jgi:hypothetical protein
MSKRKEAGNGGIKRNGRKNREGNSDDFPAFFPIFPISSIVLSALIPRSAPGRRRKGRP